MEFKNQNIGGESIFKFSFGSKDDRDRIFKGRPWSFNASHLILNEWPEDIPMASVSFITTTFVAQIHELLSVYLHEGMAKLIRSKIGRIHPDSINHRSIVAQRFLKFKVDIDMQNPISAGFFQERNNGDEFWIQFKYEQLLDFCYIYGLLNHVMGRCKLGTLAMVSTSQGITAKLYGPWLRAEHAGDLEFINPAKFESERSNLAARGKALQKSIVYNIDRGRLDDTGKQRSREAYKKENPEKELWKCVMNCRHSALH